VEQDGWIRHPRGKAYQEVIQEVKQKILAGILKPGQRLISERELAKRLGVSRNAVREGLKTLEYLGLLEVLDGQGAIVREVDPQIVAEIWSIIIVQERASFAHILEARKILESAAAGLAASKRLQDDLLNIELALAKLNRSQIDAEELAAKDIDFHHAILSATHNPLLIQITHSISELLSDHMIVVRSRLLGSIDQISAEHEKIYEAIKAGDSERASKAAFDHIASIPEQMVSEGYQV